MNYQVDKKAKESAYLQLYTQIRRDIEKGLLKHGEKLPSKRLLSKETGVSVITVEHTYGLLSDEGYVISRPKSGFYVDFETGDGRREVLRSGDTPEDDNGEKEKPGSTRNSPLISAPADFPFSVYAKVMRYVISEYDTKILRKSPNQGTGELRGAISGYLRRSRGILVKPESIVVGSGAEYLYGQIAQLAGAGTLFGLEDPSYEKIRKVYEANGARCEMLKLGRSGILSGELHDSEAKILHVTPFRSYPSGVTASAPKRHEYAKWAAAGDRLIVEDDYDSEFASVRKQIDTIYSLIPEKVIYVNTFSKTLAPSMRMGYMVLPEKLLKKYQKELGFYSCTVPVFEQYVLAEFINRGHLERYINRRRRKEAE
ncbi:MAG: PLP-dependent aminotransferase family protein [Lachnospiraceae bacterium]|nr:PLP-dependent aminotransferase family protein [Lachnospiraceae bacterium]